MYFKKNFVYRCQSTLQEMDGLKWREKLPAMSEMPTTHSPLFPTVMSPVTKPAAAKSSGDISQTGNMSDADKLELFNSEKDKGNNFVKKVS